MSLPIEPGGEILPGYKLVKFIGGGGFGDVWSVEAPGGLIKAVKIIRGDLEGDDEEETHRASQELRALKRVQSVKHPYLLSLERYDIIQGRLVIVMELADCNLWDRFKEYRGKGKPGIPRDELLRYMEETAEVLDLMNNQHQLQHLDIKPQNLFLLGNHVKVADFGLVKDLEKHAAKMTGGVTPVYAAPETFEGTVTRFCDQYSLAIVYQELLTGQRPFSGGSVQQLIMQHLRAAPNLTAVPACDRPVLAKALAKKSEDRFPDCLKFVRDLREAGQNAAAVSAPGALIGGDAPGEGRAGGRTAVPSQFDVGKVEFAEPNRTEATIFRVRREEPTTGPTVPPRVAPPEQSGPGVLKPAVVVGLGGMGLSVLREFRRMVEERFEAFDRLPHLRLLYVDTDHEATQQATDVARAGALDPNEVYPARLNRATHYLKPRQNGRSLLEGWFDPQMLYRIPRDLSTLGIRALGRLAFCDHYRNIARKVRELVEVAVHPDALSTADRNSRLGLRSNRPRVYVVSSLCGGTGSGMFLDAAYMARHRLRYLGYDRPEVVGVLLLPAVERSANRQQAMCNGYAALTELHHYSTHDTEFRAAFDDRDGNVQDDEPPFSRLVLVPLPGSISVPGVKPSKVDPVARAADLLRRELTTPFGRIADQIREQLPAPDPLAPVTAASFGLSPFSWPRQLLLSRASRRLAQRLLRSWVQAETAQVRETVRQWVATQWAAQDLGPEPLIARFQQAVEKAVGQAPEAAFNAEAEPFVPKGFFARKPAAPAVQVAVGRLLTAVGSPYENALQRQLGTVESVLVQAADLFAKELADVVAQFAVTLIEQPDFRLVGAEEALQTLIEMLAQLIQHYEPLCQDLSERAVEAFNIVQEYIASDGRKLSAADLAEAVKLFPRFRFQALILRHTCQIYDFLQNQLRDQQREVGFCKGRLEELAEALADTRAAVGPEPDGALLPAGCQSSEQAVGQLMETLTYDDLRELDRRVQQQVESRFSALFQVCMNTANLLPDLGRLILEQARAYMSGRLGEANVVDMFFARHRQPQASQAVAQAYEDAVPELGKLAGAATHAFTVLAMPPGDQGKPFVDLIRHTLKTGTLPAVCPSTEEITFYRECPRVPLASLPQLGPLAAEAYQEAAKSQHSTPHARIDVAKWIDVDQQ